MDLSIQNKLKPTKGCFLLAEPFLQEEHFHRSVIYLCEHNEDGTFGFVLNKFIEKAPLEFTDNFPGKNLTVCSGGPVDENNLFYIHKSGNLIEGSHEIGKDLFIGGNFDQIQELINSNKLSENDILFFLGYSGWTKNQLEQEVKNNSWLVVHSDKTLKHLFSFNKNLWKDLMKEQGKKYEIMSKFPDNHLWN